MPKNQKSRLKVITTAFRYRYVTGLAVGLPVLGLFSLLAILSPAHYRAQGKIKIEPSLLDQNISQTPQKPDLTQDISLLQSKPLITETLAQLKQDGVPFTQNSPENVQRSLNVRGESSTQSIELTFDDPRAKNASDFINKHIEVFKKKQTSGSRFHSPESHPAN
ncbi:MAG: hypothetical protein HC810_00240 [Acaryochloridaceae cyanobacterium RL_2_7]|nr:hypothetical protein [Acaryochloridaceae cyanobacterium RL_2_7]